VFQGVPDWKHRFDFWLDAAKTVGGHTAEAALVIASPYFSLGVAGIGIIWLAIAGEPKRRALHDHRWVYLGWAMVALLATVLGITLINGYVEIRVREAIATAPLKALERRLDTATQSCLKENHPSLEQLENKKVVVGYITGDKEAAQYGGDYLSVLAGTGLLDDISHPKDKRGTRFAIPLTSNNPKMHGVLIGTEDSNNPSKNALAMKEFLLRCGIATTIGDSDTYWNNTLIVIDQAP